MDAPARVPVALARALDKPEAIKRHFFFVGGVSFSVLAAGDDLSLALLAMC